MKLMIIVPRSLCLLLCLLPMVYAMDAVSTSPVTLYVSKLGDNTSGDSWITAYRSIQSALDAIPDANGGHRVLVRPDAYMEANLAVAHPGAQNAYNHLVGDYDGSLGSGASGWVVIDASDPATGFKSYDWWGNIRATQQGWSQEHTAPTFSAIQWDRWRLQHIYASGGDGGLFWDCTNRIEPFSLVVEDCVGIGRAFGGGVASCLSRSEEPITFRNCMFWALDWWGDTAAAYVRIENETMPEAPDVVFDNCILTSPQCALKAGNYGFHTYSRIKVSHSVLAALNFSQPVGTPSDGTIVSMQNGKYMHVELEDVAIMGYKVFGVKVDVDSAKDIGYSVSGDVKAYVQYAQPVPDGMFRLAQWPTELFSTIAPPHPQQPLSLVEDSPIVIRNMCEVSHFIWNERLCRLECVRPGQGGKRSDYYLLLREVESGKEITRFAEGYGLACAFVNEGVFYAFASRYESDNWNDVTMFSSRDLQTWEQAVVIQQEQEHLFNSSVCKTPNGFAMAYESNDPRYPAFTIKFAHSADISHWEKQADAVMGADRYAACPNLLYSDGFYYLLYLEKKEPLWFFETFMARSSDLRHWKSSPKNPLISPRGLNEGINASDPDLLEYAGNTRLYYAVGDQKTWMNIKAKDYAAPIDDFLHSWFPDTMPHPETK